MRLISSLIICLLTMFSPVAAQVSAFELPAIVDVDEAISSVLSRFIARVYGYTLDETAYGHSVTRNNQWYERELVRAKRTTGKFAIMKTPVTNAQYAVFIGETGHPAPKVAPATWQS